jgi:glutathione peroxidase
MKKFAQISIVAALLLAGPFVMIAEAKPEFAKKEKKVCGYCHLNPAGGGARGFRGMYYARHNISFRGFVEAREAKKAGVKPNAMGKASKPTKPYTGK